ncbi:MAG: CoA-binding protein [Deltaproteobacteria bacterium]|nr:CoA-binding protein [Candidatus Anaeroferrophillus wilburensis]MBN2887991.1 CoA-binding protein [Deltaproteobacteria bacterium]
METVALLGASDKKERYAYKAQNMLAEYGHKVIPVSHRVETVDGIPCRPDVSSIDETIDTVTVYVNPTILQKIVPEIIAKKPARVILNPGTEDDHIEAQLTDAGIRVVRACTLVLLRTDQYMIA